MSVRKFGAGQSVKRVEDIVSSPAGQLRLRRRRWRRAESRLRAQPLRPRAFLRRRSRRGPRHARRARRLHGQGFRRSRRSALSGAGRQRRRLATPLKPYPVMADGASTTSATSSRMVVAETMRRPATPPRPSRRLGALPAVVDMEAPCGPARRSCSTARPATSPTTRISATRRKTDAVFARRRARRASDRQSPRRRQLHGAARRARRHRQGDRRGHAGTRQPGRAHHQDAALRHDPEDAGREAARRHQGRRRRLRHQEHDVPRISARRSKPRGGSANRSPGSATAPSISSATRRAETTSPPPKWRWTRTASSSPCASTSSAISAPISACSRPTSRGSAPRWRPAPMRSASCTPACAASTPTPCRSTPIAAPAARGRLSAGAPGRRLRARDRLDPAEIRARNFIKQAQMPYHTLTDRDYDVGDFEGAMHACLAKADRAGFDARAAESKQARRAASASRATSNAPPGAKARKAR